MNAFGRVKVVWRMVFWVPSMHILHMQTSITLGISYLGASMPISSSSASWCSWRSPQFSDLMYTLTIASFFFAWIDG